MVDQVRPTGGGSKPQIWNSAGKDKHRAGGGIWFLIFTYAVARTAWVGSLRILRLPSTVQNPADQVKWQR